MLVRYMTCAQLKANKALLLVKGRPTIVLKSVGGRPKTIRMCARMHTMPRKEGVKQELDSNKTSYI